MSDNKNSHGTSDMPKPDILNYTNIYKITPSFIHDLNICMLNIAYADYKKIEKYILNEFIYVNELHEFLQVLSSFPYRYIGPLMRSIENKELFVKYFERVNEEDLKNSEVAEKD